MSGRVRCVRFRNSRERTICFKRQRLSNNELPWVWWSPPASHGRWRQAGRAINRRVEVWVRD